MQSSVLGINKLKIGETDNFFLHFLCVQRRPAPGRLFTGIPLPELQPWVHPQRDLPVLRRRQDAVRRQHHVCWSVPPQPLLSWGYNRRDTMQEQYVQGWVLRQRWGGLLSVPCRSILSGRWVVTIKLFWKISTVTNISLLSKVTCCCSWCHTRWLVGSCLDRINCSDFTLQSFFLF